MILPFESAKNREEKTLDQYNYSTDLIKTFNIVYRGTVNEV